MEAKEPSKLTQTQDRKLAAAGEDYVLLFDVANDVFHSCDVFGILVIVCLVSLLDLFCFVLVWAKCEILAERTEK